MSLEERDCKCYKCYIDAIAAVNKLLVENVMDKVKPSTIEEAEKALEGARKNCSVPLWHFADWGTKVVPVVKKPRRDKLMELRAERAPYRYAQNEVEVAFERFYRDEPEKNIRESLLESVRLALHEGLGEKFVRTKPRSQKEEIEKKIYDVGGHISEGQWVFTGTQEVKESIMEQRKRVGAKELPKTEKGYAELIDEKKEEIYKVLRDITCKI